MFHTKHITRIRDNTNLPQVWDVTYAQGRQFVDSYASCVYIGAAGSLYDLSSYKTNLVSGSIYLYSLLNIPIILLEEDYNKICQTLLSSVGNHFVAMDSYFYGMYFPRSIIFIAGSGEVSLSKTDYRSQASITVKDAEEIIIEGIGIVETSDTYHSLSADNPCLPSYPMEYWKRHHKAQEPLCILPSCRLQDPKYLSTKVIIPVLGQSKTLLSTLQCFHRIWNVSQLSGIHIVIVWSNFDKATWDIISKHLNSDNFLTSRVILKPSNEPLGFAAAVNTGVKFIHDNAIYFGKGPINIVNDDILISPLVYHALNYYVSQLDFEAIVGPVSNNIAGFQRVLDMNVTNYDDYSIYAFNRYKKLGREFLSAPVVMGTYWVCTPSLFLKRGLLDEEYGAGNWEDNDFCARNVLSGGLNVIANGCSIYHFGQQTFSRENIDYAEALAKGEERFKSKYPHYVPFSPSKT